MESKQLDTIELNRSIQQKMNKTKNEIETITEKDKGYNFEYVTLNKIEKTVYKHAKQNYLEVSTSPNWMVNKLTGDIVKTMNKEGKEWVVDGAIVFSITDLKTGYTIDFVKSASGKGTDPGQATGSAETYALRQWLNKTFQVEVEREEYDVSQKVMVIDDNGEPVEAISSDQLSSIIGTIISKTNDAKSIKADAAMMLSKYNEHYKTNYPKLKGKIPSTEFERILNYAAALDYETQTGGIQTNVEG